MLADPPKLAQLVVAYLLDGQFSGLPTNNLADLSKPGVGFALEHLLAAVVASQSTLDASSGSSMASTLRDAQMALGEDSQRLAKVDLTIKTATDIDGLPGVNAFYANVLYLLGQVLFGLLNDKDEDAASLDEIQDSLTLISDGLLVNAAVRLLHAVNSLPVRRRFAMESSDNPHLCYAFVAMLSRLGTILLSNAKKQKVTKAALSGNLSGLNVIATQFSVHLEKCIKELDDYGSGIAPIPAPASWTNSHKYKAMQKAKEQALELSTALLVQKSSKRNSLTLGGDSKRKSNQISQDDQTKVCLSLSFH